MKGCYSKGGKIRPKTIHGLRTGQHNNPNVLRAARAYGGSVHVDGERSKPRLDRPRRADGGGVEDQPYRPSNELAEGAQKQYLRDKAASARKSETMSTISGAAKRIMPGTGLSRSINQLNALTDDVAASRERQKAKTADKEAEGFKNGGRADGGRAEGPGEASNASQKQYLQSKADKLRSDAKSDFGNAAFQAGAVLANITAPKFTRGAARTKNAIANGVAAGGVGLTGSALKDGFDKRSQADTADKEADSFKNGGAPKAKGAK